MIHRKNGAMWPMLSSRKLLLRSNHGQCRLRDPTDMQMMDWEGFSMPGY